MVNTRGDLGKIPPMDNDGQSYIIPLDVYKEGYWAYNISNYFKARVGDNGTKFMVQWHEHGQLKNVLGLRPFLSGKVGQYSVDDSDPENPRVIMAADASTVDITGDTTDTREGGIAVYNMIEQGLPQSGIFYGAIGLRGVGADGRHQETSVDIAFKVLDNNVEMLGAKRFYISELEQALNEFENKMDQHDKDYQARLQKTINDANQKIATETAQSEAALNALQSEIRANRAEQGNISTHLAGIEQQIETHNVVTRPEFLNLSNQLTQQVSEMRQSGLEFFNTIDDLKNTYPQGANKLCVTLSDSHQWIYDYANGVWNDAGAFNYGTIDPKLIKAIYSENPDNIIPNSQFINEDMWNISAGSHYIEDSQDGNALVLNGFIKEGTNNESWVNIDPIPIAGSTEISVNMKILLQGIDYSNGKTASLEFSFILKDGSTQYYHRVIPAYFQDGKYHDFHAKHITYPANTEKVGIAVIMYGLGTIKIKNPQANFGEDYNPYSIKDLETKIQEASSNLLVSNPIQNWENSYNVKTFKNNNFVTIDASDINNDYRWIQSNFISVEPHSNLLLKASAKTNLNNGLAYLEVKQFDENYTTKDSLNLDFYFINSNDFKDYLFDNIVLANSTKFIKINLVTYSKVKVSVKSNIVLKYNSSISKAIKNINRYKDLFYHMPLQQWKPYNSTVAALNDLTVVTDETNIYNGLPTIKVATSKGLNTWNGLVSDEINVDPSKNISVKIVAKAKYETSQNNCFIELNQIKKDGTISTNENINIYLANTSDFNEYIVDDITLADDTVKVVVKLTLYNNAVVNIASIESKIGDTFDTDTKNVLSNLKLTNWITTSKDISTNDQSWHFNIRNSDNNYKWIYTPYMIAVNPKNKLKASITAKGGLMDNHSNMRFEIKQLTKYFGDIDNGKNIDRFFNPTSELNNYEFDDIKLNKDTKYIQVAVVAQGNVDVTITDVQLNLVDGLIIKNNFGLPRLQIDSQNSITESWQNAPFTFIDGKRKVTGFLQYAIQGDSSRIYPKKNLKVKFFKDKDCKKKLKWKPKASWQANHKFNIKANYIDATQARNLVNANLFAKATAITPFTHNSQKPLLKSQNLGQMEGFPIELYFDNEYYGLMTFNIKKDDKPFGMDSDNNDNEVIVNEVASSNYSDTTKTIDGENYSTEIHDKANDTLKENFTKFLTFVNTSNDMEFKSKLKNYVDIESIINAMLWGTLSHMWDFTSKSILLLTYNNGTTFYLTLYDMDSTWYLYWNGSKIQEENILSFDKGIKALTGGWDNILFKRVYDNFKPEIIKQYQYLRSNVWSNTQITSAFKNYIDSIPEEAYERDQEKWPDIPSKNITDYSQIQQAVITRGNEMDKFIKEMLPNTDPVANLQAQIDELKKNGTSK